MPAAKKVAGAKPAASPPLPPITVQRFEESLLLVERIAASERSGFLKEMQRFRDEHREASDRKLTHQEAVLLVSAVSDLYDDQTPEKIAAGMQNSLRAWDDPTPRDVLVGAGLSTAPALLRAVRQFVALIEMSADDFQAAFEAGTLEAELTDHAAALGEVPLKEARQRTTAAFAHWGEEVGVASGEAMRRLIETVTGALEQAAMRVTAANLSPELSHLSTGSPEPTDGAGEPSSTTPATATP